MIWWLVAGLFGAFGAEVPTIELSQAVWHAGPGLETGPGAQAGPLLAEEVEKRTGIRIQQSKSPPDAATPAIVLLLRSSAPNSAVGGWLAKSKGVGPTKPEGFELFTDVSNDGSGKVVIVGADARGVLYGVGAFLRHAFLAKGVARLEARRIDTAPAFPIRGHQLGYRAAANSYDAWDVDRYESYIRDLLVFGCNSVELIPPMDRRAPRNRHMPKSEWDMTVALSSVLDKYGMDVWLWPPVEHVDVSKPDEAEAFLKQRDELFRACKRIDAIFIPGGDPGDTPPDLLLPFLEKLTAVLHQSHPKATTWVSPQMFRPAELEKFFAYLEKNQPKWLGGIVYGPWVWMSLEETRQRVPKQYPIRNYPDITHTVRCQFAVPNFDQALAFTLGREPINPRPRAYARIHQLQAPLTAGSIAYSDGCNDDVNKMVLSVLDWSPREDVRQALQQYGRYFLGEADPGDIADGLLALEDNLVGKAATSASIPSTLVHWRKLEAKASPALLSNWRFQQPLFRAYFDAFVAERARAERQWESRALAALQQTADPRQAVAQARAILAEADRRDAAPQYRKRIWQLADALYHSIGMQLDMKTYGASGSERGAVLDYIDTPLNNRAWLERQFDNVEKSASDAEAKAMIASIVHYEDPGKGGFYDDLGDPDRQPHLMQPVAWADDPSYLRSPQCEHNLHKGARLSWLTQAQTLYGQPLTMRYEGLDRNASYRVKIVYFGRFRSTMALRANGEAIHGALPIEQTQADGMPKPVEFTIPRELTQFGTLELSWQRLEGRGCQVAEVFVIRN